MNEDLIIEIWDTFKEYVPEKSRDMAANQYVDFLLGKDVSISTLESLQGYDDHLDDAIDLVSDNDQDDDVDEVDDWDAEDYDEDR